MRDDRKRRWRVVGTGLSLLLLLGGIFAASPSQAQSTAAEGTVDRLLVAAGGTVTVKVNGFDQYEPLSSWASSVRGTVYSTAAGETDYFGGSTLVIQTGRFWEPGWWAVTVNGEYSDIRTIVRFEIAPAVPDGKLEIDRSTAEPGSSIGFRGAGFSGGETISIWATRPDGGVNPLPDLSSPSGDISFRYDLPGNAAPGDWSMTAYGLVSGRLLIVPFFVTPK